MQTEPSGRPSWKTSHWINEWNLHLTFNKCHPPVLYSNLESTLFGWSQVNVCWSPHRNIPPGSTCNESIVFNKVKSIDHGTWKAWPKKVMLVPKSSSSFNTWHRKRISPKNAKELEQFFTCVFKKGSFTASSKRGSNWSAAIPQYGGCGCGILRSCTFSGYILWA